MIKCFKCGKESARSSVYFISSGPDEKNARLHGAAELGLCPDCIAEGYKKLGVKPAITMVLWLALSMAALLVSAKLGVNAPAYIKVLCVIVSITGLYNGVRDMIVVSVYRKRRSDIRAFLPEMTQTDFNEQVNTHLAEVSEINDGVLFNFGLLRNGENYVSSLKPDGQKKFTRRIRSEELAQPPKNLCDGGKELDGEILDKIHAAVLKYWE